MADQVLLGDEKVWVGWAAGNNYHREQGNIWRWYINTCLLS